MPEALPSPNGAQSDGITAEVARRPAPVAADRPAISLQSGGLWSAERRPLTVGLVLTITLVAAEALAVSTAMPIVAADLGGLELYGLVFSAFLVGSLVGIVVAGSLIDHRGVILPFLLGLAFFAVGLMLGGAAVSMPMLIGARLIQGIGGGAIPPIAYVAIGRSLPERLRPQMFATLSTAWILPGIFGPAIAGVVAEKLHWRLIFFGLLPVLVVSGSMAYRGLRRLSDEPPTAAAAAATGARIRDGLIVGIGVALLTAGLASDNVPVEIGAGILGLVITFWAFVRLVPAGTLRADRGYPTAVLLRGLLTFAFFSIDAYVALLLVQVRGWSAAEAGIALTAATLSWTAGSWIQARLSKRFRPEWFVRVGFPIVAVGLAGLGLILLPDVPALLSLPVFALAGLGMGLTYSQFALIVLRDVPRDSQGAVTSGLTLSDSLGTALGTSVAAAFVSTAVRTGGSPAPGLAAAIAVGTGAAVLGWLLSPRLHRESAPAAVVAESPARLR
jgi:MFS family permease